MKFHFSTHHFIGVGNKVNWSGIIDHPNFIFSHAPKKLDIFNGWLLTRRAQAHFAVFLNYC